MALHLSLFSADTAARIQNVYFDENKAQNTNHFVKVELILNHLNRI